MRKTGWIAIVLLSASSILLSSVTKSAFCAEQPGKLAPVRIGIVSRSTLDMPFYVAREQSFFPEEGLEAEIILIKANLEFSFMSLDSISVITGESLKDVRHVEYHGQVSKAWPARSYQPKGTDHQDPLATQERRLVPRRRRSVVISAAGAIQSILT